MRKRKFSPIFMFLSLTLVVLLLSFILSIFGAQAEYTTVNSYTNALQNNVVQVENMLSSSGLKYIVTNAVSNFVNFEPLAMLIIVLMGIGVLEKSGFTKTFFTLITQNFRKNTITFTLILLGMISSLFGHIGFVVLLPIGGLLFKYGHRHPLGGVISAFAGVCFGFSLNVFLTSTDTSLLMITQNAAHVIDSSYTIESLFQIFIMIVASIGGAIALTRVTEKTIMPLLGKYEFDEIETLDANLTNRELRGLILSIGAALVYLVIIVYMILPGLPLSGGLLDNNGTFYIDKLFGENSLFAQGFVFIVMFFFLIVGLVYGIVAKTIRNSKDMSEALRYSLDGMGYVLVLMFVASLFISVFNKSNIGTIVVALLTNLINAFNFGGLGLIIILFVISIIASFFSPGYVSKWQMMSGSVVPAIMNASISPEMAQVVYTAGSSLGLALTPVMAYYVVYVAIFDKYGKDETSFFGPIKYMKHYAIVMAVMWLIIILAFYITGLPIGVGTSPVLSF